MNVSRFSPQASVAIMHKYLSTTVQPSLTAALTQAGIDPALLAAQLPAVLAAFVPALASNIVTAMTPEGCVLAAFEGSPLLREVIANFPAGNSQPMRPVTAPGMPQTLQPAQRPAAPQNFQPAQPVAQPQQMSGDNPPSFTDDGGDLS